MKLNSFFKFIASVSSVCALSCSALRGVDLGFKQSDGRIEVRAICHETYSPKYLSLETDTLFFLIRRDNAEDISCEEGEVIETGFPIEAIKYTWQTNTPLK